MKTKHFLLSALMLVWAAIAHAQLNIPASSPGAEVSQNIGLAKVSVNYSRPAMRGRVIFGDLVPYGALWRTGANAATRISLSDDVMINGQKLAKGEYSIFSTPGKDQWTIMLNKDANASTGSYKAENNVLTFNVKPVTLASNVESFTIGFNKADFTSAEMYIEWEKTRVSFTISHDTDTKVTAQINSLLNPNRDAGLYYQIASYYHDNNKELEKAHELISKSVEMDPKFWTVHLKAKIEAKLKKYDMATASAQRSASMAREANNNDYVRLNEKLIEEIKKMK